jgi:hypothetical protein
MMGLALGLLTLVVPALAGDLPDCSEPTTVVDFLEAAEQGEAAFASMDLPALSTAREQGLALIPCLGEPLTPRDAAAFHRMMALAAFTSGDSAGVMREFHAARRLEPGYQIPVGVAPSGHPLVQLYEQSTAVEEGELEPAIPPRGGWVGVDGVRGAPRPAGISAVVQVFDQGDALHRSLYLLPDEPLPVWGPLPIDALLRKRRRVVLVGISGGAVVASGVFYGLAWRENQRFWEPVREDSLDYADLEVIKLRANAFTATSLSCLGLAAGVGITTAVVW